MGKDAWKMKASQSHLVGSGFSSRTEVAPGSFKTVFWEFHHGTGLCPPFRNTLLKNLTARHGIPGGGGPFSLKKESHRTERNSGTGQGPIAAGLGQDLEKEPCSSF